MKYEVTILLELHEDADFYGTDDALENIYSLMESAIGDIDDMKLLNLEILEQ